MNNRISKFNMSLYQCCERLNSNQSITFADMNYVLESRDMQRYGVNMTRSGRAKLDKYICDLITYLKNTNRKSQPVMSVTARNYSPQSLTYISTINTEEGESCFLDIVATGCAHH